MMDVFHHARAIQRGSAGSRRWPSIRSLRAEGAAGRQRWRRLAGPFRTARAARRAARRERDSKGLHYEWFPGAIIYAIAKESDGWFVFSRPARGKAGSATRKPDGGYFAEVLPEVPF